MAATRGELFAGVTVAIVTPFRNGEIDWDDLGKLVDWHCEQGTDALAPCGTTGESPTLTHDENERVASHGAFRTESVRGDVQSQQL
jgi:4-hydroxy-tetrahydrodipicolinate synthase